MKVVDFVITDDFLPYTKCYLMEKMKEDESEKQGKAKPLKKNCLAGKRKEKLERPHRSWFI